MNQPHNNRNNRPAAEDFPSADGKDNASPSYSEVASFPSPGFASTPRTSTPIFSQGEPAAISDANLPVGRKTKANLARMTRRELKKAPRLNLSTARLSKPPQRTTSKPSCVDDEGFTLVTSNKRKASAVAVAPRARPPIPSFSQAGFPPLSPATQHVTKSVPTERNKLRSCAVIATLT